MLSATQVCPPPSPPSSSHQEEEEHRLREEERKREEEEYLKLKASFIVEEQGEAEPLSEDQVRLRFRTHNPRLTLNQA